jgi:hypothetical protein
MRPPVLWGTPLPKLAGASADKEGLVPLEKTFTRRKPPSKAAAEATPTAQADISMCLCQLRVR